ncbi:hypothetical protein RAJCM14343_4625 [Rhodococcus aetherivorans]|uniref:Uncharacterized protein n=1 Tax=Rhodococcus aetherivorans TaxID=191292 RepID=A0ABQ0YS28_9NOCA|nr:hypothetical protein RAJCM14343_4625 [Rhodococcus aetherivorans]
MPQREVRVLHRQRGPRRCRAAAPSGIRGDQVPGQRSHRRAVGADVVHHEHEQVLGLAQPEEPDPHRHLGGDIEALVDEFGDGRERFVLGHGDGCEVDPGLLDRQDQLVAGAVVLRVDGAQHLVPGHDVVDRGPQRGDVEVAGEPNRQRNVVDGGAGVEAVEEPHPLLRQRQRDPLRARLRHQRGPAPAPCPRLEPRRQRSDRRRLEHLPHRNLRVQRRPQPCCRLRGDERVATELEEVVVRADPLDSEHLGEHRCHDLLDGGGRGAELLGLENRLRQRLPVQLSVRRQRNRFQLHHDRRHHVRRQRPAHEVLQHVRVDPRTRHRENVRYQRGHSWGGRMPHRRREVHRLVRRQHRVNLTEFDAETAHLDLEVAAPDVLEHRTGRSFDPPHHVTGAVHPRTRLDATFADEGIGHESLCGQGESAVVAACHTGTRQVELTRDAQWRRVQPAVEHVRRHAAQRDTDRHRAAGFERIAARGEDGGLRRAVDVEEVPARRPLGDELGGIRLTTDHHRPQRVKTGRIHRRQRRRCDEGVRDPFPPKQVRQFRTAVHPGRHDHHRGAGTDRQQQLEHRGVETR